MGNDSYDSRVQRRGDWSPLTTQYLRRAVVDDPRAKTGPLKCEPSSPSVATPPNQTLLQVAMIII